MRVDVWSDVVCPWCAIGHRRLAEGLAAYGAAGGDLAGVTVVPRAFQLDPHAPREATPLPEAYAAKFGGDQRAAQLIAQVTEIAAEVGWEFHLDRALRANTFDAHRVIALGATLGEGASPERALAIESQIMTAYFTDGRDIGDRAVLLDCARLAGMDVAGMGSALDRGSGTEHVAADLDEAAERGITAVPTFVFGADRPDGGFALSGAQDPRLFARVLSRLTDAVRPSP